ncbi:MAG TPA: nucleoside hydrolase [Planctomycetota bacterium]|nr:nucleoside hydrolase [Planctomycetota bacterium]
MRKVAGLLLLALASCAAPQAAGSPPVAILFDSDMNSDCDDVAALAVLHRLADLGEARILGTAASSTNEDSALCIAAINAWYGRPELPVGVPKGPGTSRASKYAAAIARRYPHSLRTAADAPEAARLYRDLLLKEPDRSVVLVTVGYLTNVAALLKLPDGPDVVRRKVRLWACMGGNFVGSPPKDDLKLGNVNFTMEKAGALEAIRNWPAPLVFVGREVCSVPSGLKIGARFRELPEDHPVRVGYALYFDGVPKDRHVADPATVLYAVRGLGERWTLQDRGHMDLHADMTFEWRMDGDANQGYLLKRPGGDRAIERELEALLGLN